MRRDDRGRNRVQFYRAFYSYVDEQEQEHNYPVFILKLPDKDEEGEAILRFKEEVPEEISERYMRTGAPMILKVDEGGGMDVYEGVVTYQLKLFVHVQNLSFQERISRREERKVPMVESGMIYEEAASDGGEIPVIFQNLSVGGVGFVLKDPEMEIKEKGYYYFIFEKTQMPITLTFQVRWVRRLDDGRLSAGGQFVGVRRGQEEQIRKYVFEVEREEIRRQKDLADRMEDMELNRKMLEEKAKEILEEQGKRKGGR